MSGYDILSEPAANNYGGSPSLVGHLHLGAAFRSLLRFPRFECEGPHDLQESLAPASAITVALGNGPVPFEPFRALTGCLSNHV